MFSHMMVGSNDLEQSKKFYDAFDSWAPRPARATTTRGRPGYRPQGMRSFMVTTPIDGEPATHGNGSTIGFAFDSPSDGRRLARGGRSPPAARRSRIRPASREGEFGSLYLAYLRDPDGNKLCALHRDAGRI